MSSRNAMSASELTRIRRAQALSTGVSRPAGTGFSEDLLEKNFAKGPIVVNGLTVSDCCSTPDPEYTVLFYVSDPETGDVPRSLRLGGRSISAVSAYYMDKSYLDENGKRKSRAQIRADLVALRPVTDNTPKVETPKYIDISGRRVRTEREVKERKVKVITERVMVSRSGIPTATINFSTGGTAMTIREYVNGAVSVEETFSPYTSDSYTPTQACVLSIICPGLEYLNISGSNITQIKFNEAELQSLNDLEMYDLSLTTPVAIPSLNSLEYLEIGNSSLASVTFGYLPQLYEVYIYDITSLKKLDFSTVGTSYNLYYFEVHDMHNLTELILNNLRFNDEGNCEIYDNPSLSLLSIANVGYIYDIDIYDNTIDTLLIDGVSYLDNDIDIYNNTIGTLTIKNIGNINDIDIYDNTVQRIYVSNIGNCDRVDIYNNTGLTVVDIRNGGNIGISIRGNSGLTTFTIQNVVTLDYLRIGGPDLTSYTLTNVYNMNSLVITNANAMTSMTVGDPSVNNTLQYLTIEYNANLTTLTLESMPSLFQLVIANNPVLLGVVLPALPSLFNIYITNNSLLNSIQATQLSTTINEAYYSNNPVLETLDVSGGTYNLLGVNGNTTLNTLDMSNITVKSLNVNNNQLTSVTTGIQTITGNYRITNESALTTLNLATVTLGNAGQQLNISNNTSLANVTMPTTLVNGLNFYMNNCNINQTAANVIEEYFYYSNSQALNNCVWTILTQSFGTLSTAAPPGWTTLVTTRGWIIN